MPLIYILFYFYFLKKKPKKERKKKYAKVAEPSFLRVWPKGVAKPLPRTKPSNCLEGLA
jgi:hypothetical protein